MSDTYPQVSFKCKCSINIRYGYDTLFELKCLCFIGKTQVNHLSWIAIVVDLQDKMDASWNWIKDEHEAALKEATKL